MMLLKNTMMLLKNTMMLLKNTKNTIVRVSLTHNFMSQLKSASDGEEENEGRKKLAKVKAEAVRSNGDSRRDHPFGKISASWLQPSGNFCQRKIKLFSSNIF